MRKSLQQKPIFRSLLISNLIVFLVPFLFSLIGYPYFGHTIREEILSTHELTLKQIKSNFDHDLHLIQNANSALTSNYTLEQLSKEQVLSARDRVDIVSLQKELRSFCNEISVISDMGVYLNGSGGLISTSRYYDQSILHVFTSGFQMDPNEFLQNIRMDGIGGMQVVRTPVDTQLFFIRNLFDYGSRQIAATVFCIVPWSNLSEIDGIPFNSSLSWNQDTGEVLLSKSSSGLGIPSADQLPSSGELVFTKENHIGYVSSSIASDYQNILYVLTVPTRQYFSRLNYFHIMIAAEIITALAAGAFLVFRHTYRNYRPLERMLSLLQSGKDVESQCLDYDTMEKELKTLLNERKTLDELQKEKQESLKNSLLSTFLKGQNTDLGLIEHFWGKSIELLHQKYQLIAFTILSPEESTFFQGLSSGDSVQAFSLLIIALRKHLQQHLPPSTLYVTVDSMLIAIMENRQDEERKIDQSILSCVLSFREKLGLNLFATISLPHHSPGNLHHAYSELSEAMAYHYFWDDRQPVLYYEGSPISSSDILDLPGEDIYQLKNLLNVQDYQKAHELLNDILDRSLSRDISAMDYNRCNMSALAAILIGSLHYSYQNDPSEKTMIRPLIKELAQTDSLSRFREIVHTIFDQLTKINQDRIQADMPIWLHRVEEYVQKHFPDPNLNMSQIADQFDLSLSHIGRIFKKYRGISLLEYIHYTRIQHSKQLLLQGYSVREAAEMSGYLDSKSMIRVFKKFEGITPGQFKSSVSS